MKYDHAYLIRYEIQNEDGFWDCACEEEVYVSSDGAGKNLHAKAEKQFREKYKGRNIKVKSVIYC